MCGNAITNVLGQVLGHITTAISEAGFAVLKSGKLAVHAQMGIDMTAGVLFTQERLSRQRGALRSDRNVNTIGLPNARHETQALKVCGKSDKKTVFDIKKND
jgi:hypothetical protein